jgi:hypothetical protein
MLARGVTTMSETRYDACLGLINNAEANNHAACDDNVAEIIGLDNIQGGNIVNRDGESVLLSGSLLPTATVKYTDALSAGDNDEYRAAVSQNAASALRNGIIKKARNELTISRSELEFFIDAASLRLGGEEALAFIDGRLAEAQEYAFTVPRDDFAAIADESVTAHIDFLTRLRRSVELGMGGNATDEMLAQKSALQTELLSALDNNDLSAARDIRAAISNIDEMLADMPGGVGAAAAAAAQDVMSSVTQTLDEGGDSDDLLADIDALGGLLPSNFAAVFPMLENIQGRLLQKRDVDDDASYNAAINAVETLMLDNRDAYNRVTAAGLSADEALSVADAYFNGDNEGARLFDDGLIGGAGTGGGASTSGSGISAPGAPGRRGDDLTGNGAALAGTITSIATGGDDLASGFADAEDLSDAEKDAVLVLALAMYADEFGDTSLNGLMRAEANRLLETNGLIFEELRESSAQYVPARMLADYLKLRYVWNKNLNGGALARGGGYRFYTVYSAEIITGPNREDVDYMAFPAAYKNEMYLPDDYTYEAFGIWAESIPGTGFAVLVSKEISDCAAELLSRFIRTAEA